ncbi:hypothetical protein BYT27DRAFT_7041201, partial [Phlegmacium glaucopus]
RQGLTKGSKKGLFQFFSQGTKEQNEEYHAQETDQYETMMQDDQYKLRAARLQQAETKKERARLWKQKQWETNKRAEIKLGLRSPGGRKRQVSIIKATLTDTKHKVRSSTAKLSRPGRAIKRKFKSEHKKPQGQKAKVLVQQAKYYNWFSPFLWSQIEVAVKQVGWKMGASEIVDAVKRINPVNFEGLSRTTVKSWIDRSGNKPKWTNAVL